MSRLQQFAFALALMPVIYLPAQESRPLQSKDLTLFRSVGEVHFSPDGRLIAYTVSRYDGPGRPYSQIWVMDPDSGKTRLLAGETEHTSSPRWSPDSKLIAYMGSRDQKQALLVAHADGSAATFLAAVSDTNSPLPGQGDSFTWSPDGKQIAYVSSVSGPYLEAAAGDPMVIARYLYKPTAGEGMTRFNDNRQLHLFTVDISSKEVKQLTKGPYDEHSVDWSPDGREIVFASNHEPNADEFFNYDLFALNISTGVIRRLTATENCEYAPHWSPDGKSIAYLGTKRGLTDRETTMEDTHAWVMNADGANRHEIGAAIDNRQHALSWLPDSSGLLVAVQERGSNHLMRLSLAGSAAATLVGGVGAVGGFSIGRNNEIAYAYTSTTDMAQLFLRTKNGAGKQLTALNSSVLAGKSLGASEAFTFTSNDNKFEVEGFLVKPPGLTADSKAPLIVNLHGGPHGQNGPQFEFKDQAYAAHGFAVLHINYRGSTGYGQRFADAVFGDQDGNEAQDVLYGISAAVRRYLWIDRERMGVEGVSYGGQLSDWLITQTNEFKAAIPIAGIANLISYNYMTYYNQYEEMEFGQFLHQGRLMDEAWERSALKHVANVHTPTMLVHGENDNDVPIAEAEQYFVALKDVGVDTVMVRYPREGHGVRETRHLIDLIDRSIAWYEGHFVKSGTGITNVQP